MTRTSAPSRPYRPWVSVVGALILLSGALLGWFIHRVDPGVTGELALDRFFARHRTPFFDTVALILEVVDGPKVTPWLLVAGGLTLFLLRRRAMALIVVLMTGLSWLPGHFAKSLFPRTRPPMSLDPVVVYHDVASFPSGHTGFAVAAAVAITFMLSMWRRRTTWAKVLGTVIVLAIAVSRVYAAAHYFYDVLGGALLAGGTAMLLWAPATALWTRAQQHRFWVEPGQGPREFSGADAAASAPTQSRPSTSP